MKKLQKKCQFHLNAKMSPKIVLEPVENQHNKTC